MEKFLTPKSKTKFVQWLLELSLNYNWTITLEYSGNALYTFLLENSTTVDLPLTARHEYHEDYKLTAINNFRLTQKFINKLIKSYSVLSVHDEKEMIFLIADDFDKDCFSCTENFYQKYYQELKNLHLIY